MFSYLFEWIKNIAYCMILITAFMHVLPNSAYEKYIRFFTGMILVLLLISPILQLFGGGQQIGNLYNTSEYEEVKREIEDTTRYLESIDVTEYFPEEYAEEPQGEQIGEESIKIQTIEIGE